MVESNPSYCEIHSDYEKYTAHLKDLQSRHMTEDTLTYIFKTLKSYVKQGQTLTDFVVIPYGEYMKILDIEKGSDESSDHHIDEHKRGRYNYLRSEVNYYHQVLFQLRKQLEDYNMHVKLTDDLNALLKVQQNSEEDTQIRESISKFHKYIRIIDIGKQLNELELKKQNYDNDQELYAIIEQLKNLQSETSGYESEISKINTVLSKSQQKIGSLDAQFNQNQLNIDRMNQLTLSTDQLSNDIAIYTESDKVFSKLPNILITDHVKHFVHFTNTILRRHTNLYLVAKLTERCTIDMHIIGDKGLILKYPSESESVMIKIAINRALQELTTRNSSGSSEWHPNMLCLDDVFNCFDEMALHETMPEILKMIKSYYDVILILSHEKLQSIPLDNVFTINQGMICHE